MGRAPTLITLAVNTLSAVVLGVMLLIPAGLPALEERGVLKDNIAMRMYPVRVSRPGFLLIYYLPLNIYFRNIAD